MEKILIFKTVYFIPCVFVLLFGCQPAQTNSVKKSKGLAQQHLDTPALQVSKEPIDTAELIACPLGEPEPIIDKKVFPGATFKLAGDRKLGIQHVDLGKGDRVEIRISGCEYYVLTCTFETSRFSADTTNLPYWFDKTNLLMHQLNKGLKAPIEIDTALNRLSDRLSKYNRGMGIPLQLGEEVDFGGQDPRQYFSIDRISQVSKKRYQIQIVFAYGPI
ncbi:MAG: hypothetical protein EOO88_00780 [Pedobacter sp.]|nr:MAG: hypothetical protein EOO88_00780 [Pedobacter sp.]